jgi:hypothetical protein
MSNFAQDIEEATGGEAIEGIVIGEMGWSDYNEEGRLIPKDKKNVVLQWSEARPLLDYEYSTGYGAPECHAIYAYTATRVIYVYQYDGATGVVWLPRNPIDGPVEMPGG